AEAGHVLPYRLLDGVLVVRLHVDGAEAWASRGALGPLEQVLDRSKEAQRLGLKAEPLVRCASVLVRHLHAQRQHGRVLRVAQTRGGRSDQLARRTLPPAVRRDVKVAEVADSGVIQLREREAEDPAPIVLG